MKSYRFSFLLSAAIALCASAFSGAADRMSSAVASVQETFSRCRDWVVSTFDSLVVALAARAEPSAPPVLMVKARQYTARLLKRETPRIEASWRMCPST